MAAKTADVKVFRTSSDESFFPVLGIKMLWVRERIAADQGDLLTAAGTASQVRIPRGVEKAMTGRSCLTQPRAPSLPQNPPTDRRRGGPGCRFTNPRKSVTPVGSGREKSSQIGGIHARKSRGCHASGRSSTALAGATPGPLLAPWFDTPAYQNLCFFSQRSSASLRMSCPDIPVLTRARLRRR